MAKSIVFDTSGFDRGMKRVDEAYQKGAKLANEAITDEVMRLSSKETPLRDGYLLASLGKENEGEYTIIVGYNKVYAARLHEHPEYNFRNGRKGKYLIDPIINNLSVFKEFAKNIMSNTFS